MRIAFFGQPSRLAIDFRPFRVEIVFLDLAAFELALKTIASFRVFRQCGVDTAMAAITFGSHLGKLFGSNFSPLRVCRPGHLALCISQNLEAGLRWLEWRAGCGSIQGEGDDENSDHCTSRYQDLPMAANSLSGFDNWIDGGRRDGPCPANFGYRRGHLKLALFLPDAKYCPGLFRPISNSAGR